MKMLVIFSSLFLFACSDVTNSRPSPPPKPPDPGENISAGPVSGQIAASSWEFVSGRAVIGELNGEEAYLVELWDSEPNDICNPFSQADRGIRFNVPSEAGAYELGPSQPLSFYNGNSTNVTRDNGLIVIKEEVFNDDDGRFYAVGGLKAVYDAANIANGSFEVVICD